jgi:hypothetical protein
MDIKTIEANSVPADPCRAMTAALPLRVIAGRGLVDARGRIIATARCDGAMDAHGYIVHDADRGLTFTQADANAHAIAHALNNAPRLADALRDYVRTIEHLQRVTNPEEWATHGDWSTLAMRARAALSGETVTPAASPVADALRELVNACDDNNEFAAYGGQEETALENARAALGETANDEMARCNDCGRTWPSVNDMPAGHVCEQRNNPVASIDVGPVNALRANMRHAVWNRETCTIGGGDFSPDEMRAILATLDSLAPQS